ncbi:DUF4058 family protein [Candidatus Entotheonella palauensis]|uniref:DUF4058 domain-containing protein n=1 Tax=Candidatus Entotheonella gemina TaxID=1429439 RepID=W4M5W2_9BACT|nr:DUF4058 family protein [Candidatus Entotheonella palauensis]ETX05027.1 MAG: hypothetical protein ETSY2_25380 [Candidatus Entotheonella gemina]
MPSPFPGMDPYIESPLLWSDFHNNLASEMQMRLNQYIQPRYFARLTPYVTYESVDIGQTYRVIPDVGISQPQPPPESSVTATATITPPLVESLVPLEMPLRLHRVEIRATETQQLVTVIEILSPVNKRPSHQAYLAYQRKRRDILHSEVHLIEIDLLRGGERPPLERPVPMAPYYVIVSRQEQRPRVNVWPIQLADRLPVLPIPLLAPDPDVPMPLGEAVANVYERAAYARQIDYTQPPPPPALSEADAAWIKTLLGHLASDEPRA